MELSSVVVQITNNDLVIIAKGGVIMVRLA